VLQATYRLQLTPDFSFQRAAAIIPYLAALGVSHVYLSPIFEAVPGSTHGYDVSDPTRIRTELGGSDAFRAFAGRVRSAGLGIIIDIVPNHMAAHAANPWWWDVLKHGRGSAQSDTFDIDWDAAEQRIVVPTLGQPLEDVLSAGELTTSIGSPHDDGEPVLKYYETVLPLRPDVDPQRTPLAELVAAQHYQLMFWREGEQHLNYRRFFDIDELAAVRIDDESVFDRTHTLIAELASECLIDGVRVDHIDGLRDPTAYLQRLRRLLNDHATDHQSVPVYVEKILMGDEPLPDAWRGLVAGTTGYEFINAAEPVFVDQDGLELLERDALEHDRILESFEDLSERSKVHVLDRLFEPEVDRLIAAVADVAGRAELPQCVPDALRRALITVTAALGVYRTYHGEEPPDAEASRRLAHAFERSGISLRNDDDARTALDVVRSVLVELPYTSSEADVRADAIGCIRSWQQLSGPAAAKGVEDTAVYRHVVLTSLNEVGCEPVRRRAPLDTFHDTNLRRQADWPQSMLATATHDTKRGEDTRARIHVLSEVATSWNEALARWSSWHEPMRRQLDVGPCPGPAHEALLYQALLGIWPADESLDESVALRLSDYMIKAARESKRRTSWRLSADDYEDGLTSFVNELVLGDGGARFREDVQPMLAKMMFFGAINSLSRLTAKLMAPGVPDTYQGTELWDLSLVDPDNRRPVEYERRETLLRDNANESLEALRDNWRDGRIKLALLHRLLRLRVEHAQLIAAGDYQPAHMTGSLAEHVWAFTRSHGSHRFIVIGARRCANLTGPEHWPIGDVWGDTMLSVPSDSINALRCAIHDSTMATDGGAIALRDVFQTLPLAVLVTQVE